jgi:hypothetical protein
METAAMKAVVRTSLTIVLWGALVASASAQWTAYVPPSVPKGADGTPDLNAPAPRLPDGKPDFSGVWENAPIGAGEPGAGAAAAPANPTDPPLASFFNIGAGFKDGLPFQPWAAELLKKRRADNDKDNPDAHCLPMGLLQFHEHPQPRKIVQTKDILVIIYEANYGLRQIFLDGRSLPSGDPQPWWYGYSVGRWEGDTLVVQTSGLRDGGWLDIWGSPLTDAAKITERFRRPNFGRLLIDVTIDDPKAYTKPFTVRFDQHLTPDQELIEFICNENEQSSKHLLGNGVPANASTFTLDQSIFDRYVGSYQLAPGSLIAITRRDNHFFAQLPGQPPFEIFASSEREFFLNAFDARLTFEVDGGGRATALVLHTDTDSRAPKIR